MELGVGLRSESVLKISATGWFKGRLVVKELGCSVSPHSSLSRVNSESPAYTFRPKTWGNSNLGLGISSKIRKRHFVVGKGKGLGESSPLI